jgi:Domain of unknown function (DUF4262)
MRRTNQPPDDEGHEDTCECTVCKMRRQGVAEAEIRRRMRKFEADSMREYGFYAHAVADDPEGSGMCNVHTHGLTESFKHPDLQIVLPIETTVFMHVLHRAVNMIRTGTRFHCGVDYKGICGGRYPVRFVEAEETGRPILRMILPDKDGIVERETMDLSFAKQYDHLRPSSS